MSNRKTKKSGTEILADIVAYACDLDVFPSSKDAHAYLKEHKIDNTKLNDWAQNKLIAIKARQKLSLATERRQKFNERFEAIRSMVSSNPTELRKRVMEKLRVLASSSTESALVYCRKFESTPDEDLPDLEAEIMMLDEWDDTSDQ